jgi:hypothetical protein
VILHEYFAILFPCEIVVVVASKVIPLTPSDKESLVGLFSSSLKPFAKILILVSVG